jgi:hypothetical protein
MPRTASTSPYFQRFSIWMAAPEEGGHPTITPSAGIPGLANPMAFFELHLDTHNLLYAVILKVGVLRSERRLRIDPKNIGIASQALNPTLEAFGLPRHKTGVMKGMSQDRNALHGGKQVHSKAVGVFPLS